MQTEQYLSEHRSYKLVAVKVIVTVVLLALLASQIEFQEIKSIFRGLDVSFFGLAIVVHASAFVIFSVRWWWLLRAHEHQCKFSKIFGSYYLGLFFNNLLPTGVGGDVVRILRLRKMGINTKSLISSTVVDRIVGLTTIIAMGSVAVLTLPEVQRLINPVIGFLIVMLPVVAIFYLFISPKGPLLVKRMLNKHKDPGLLRSILETLEVLFEFRNVREKVLASFCLSLLAQHLVIITYICIGYSLGMTLSAAIFFSIVPIVFVTTSLPISIGGLGIREATLVTLLTLFAVDKQVAIALSLLYFFIMILLTLPGGLVILSNQRKVDSADAKVPDHDVAN